MYCRHCPAGNSAGLTLPVPGSAGSLSDSRNLVIDAEAVYASGSGTSTLTFTYTVDSISNHTSGDLDYTGPSALILHGGSISDAIGNNAILTLAAPGEAGSLSYNKDLVIDTTAPSVGSVTSPLADGTYGTGYTVPVNVIFDETVQVTGVPHLAMETGTTDAVAEYISGSGTDTLTFTYTVSGADNHTAVDLDYTGTGSLFLNGGAIVDAAGNRGDLSLSVPGTARSLGANKSIVVNSAPVSVEFAAVSSTVKAA